MTEKLFTGTLNHNQNKQTKPETKNRKSNLMLVLLSFYAITIFSKVCEYLGSALKVPTEINGFLLSIDASLYQKRKIENLILC